MRDAWPFFNGEWKILHSMRVDMQNKGAYILWLEAQKNLVIQIGSLGKTRVPKGHLLYVGSARKNLAQRIARHKRLGEDKQGKLHWHIDYLLTHKNIRLREVIAVKDGNECLLSHDIASQKGVTVPIPRFGATDCKSGCPAHLYKLLI